MDLSIEIAKLVRFGFDPKHIVSTVESMCFGEYVETTTHISEFAKNYHHGLPGKPQVVRLFFLPHPDIREFEEQELTSTNGINVIASESFLRIFCYTDNGPMVVRASDHEIVTLNRVSHLGPFSPEHHSPPYPPFSFYAICRYYKSMD